MPPDYRKGYCDISSLVRVAPGLGRAISSFASHYSTMFLLVCYNLILEINLAACFTTYSFPHFINIGHFKLKNPHQFL